MRRHAIIVGLLMAGLIVSPSAGESPQVKDMMVVGTGVMVEGDVGRARQDAILSALKEAVRICLLEFVPSSVLEENAAALEMEVFSHVTQYVQTFKILSETGKTDGHEVLLQAQIDLLKLRDSLSTMGLLERKPGHEEVVTIRMVLAGISRYPWYREFEDFLREELNFIRGVRLRSVMTGEFTLDVELVGGLEALLDTLTTREFEGFLVEIDQGREDRVMVRFRPKGS
jgi:hypothetical protein